MTFPLRSANLLLLHRELWCSRRASLTKTTSTRSHWLRRGATLGSVKAFHQMTAQPEHIQKEVLGHTQCLSVSFSSFFPPSPCHSYTKTQKNSQIWQSSATETQEQRQKLAKGGIPVSLSSPVSAFHQRHEQPVRVKLPIPKPRSGAVSKTMDRWLPSLDITVFIYFPLDS